MLFGDVAPRSRTQRVPSDERVREISPMPLERRVILAAVVCRGDWSEPVDDPRKNFMSFRLRMLCLEMSRLPAHPLVFYRVAGRKIILYQALASEKSRCWL